MKLAVICANGRAGQLIVEEALTRGINVTSIARGKNKTASKKYLEKDIFKLTYEDLKDFDVIINAFGTWAQETLNQHSTSLKYLCDILSNRANRLLVVGGAGSLYINPEHTLKLMDSPDFPDIYKPVAINMGMALEDLRRRNDVNWTYISPAIDFEADKDRTGSYTLAGEELTLNSRGESKISYADYAIAVLDEAISGKNIQKRISILSE